MTLVFLFKLTLCWAFFALLYGLLLRHETFFRANRAYLLGTLVLGIVLALDLDWLPAGTMPVVVLPTFTVGLQQAAVTTASWAFRDYLWLAYGLGAGFSLLRFGWAFGRLLNVARRSQVEALPDGCLLLRSTATHVPFSFFKWIFVPEQDHPDAGESADRTAMLLHERAHARGWHSVDVVVLELLCIVFWFHPLVHWYRRALRNVHEYLADAEASRALDLKQYGLLLIRQSQSGIPVALVHHFFQSPLKQRFIMLTKKASAPARILKYGLLLPLTFSFVLLFHHTPVIAQTVEEVQKPEAGTNGDQVYPVCEKMPEFPGGSAALMQFLVANIHYPAAARKENAEGLVAMHFIVAKDGTVQSVRELSHAREDFAEEAKRVIALMPRWTPAEEKGQKVACEMTLPIKFKLN